MRPTELVGAAHQEVTVQVLNQSPALSLVGISRDTVLSLVDIYTVFYELNLNMLMACYIIISMQPPKATTWVLLYLNVW